MAGNSGREGEEKLTVSQRYPESWPMVFGWQADHEYEEEESVRGKTLRFLIV